MIDLKFKKFDWSKSWLENLVVKKDKNGGAL